VFLYENIQHLTVLIHNPPEIMAFAIDGDKDLIHVPRVIWARLGDVSRWDSDNRRKDWLMRSSTYYVLIVAVKVNLTVPCSLQSSSTVLDVD
jgi:hypothetical protein